MDGSRGTKDFRTEPAAGLENTNMDFPAGGKINTISVNPFLIIFLISI